MTKGIKNTILGAALYVAATLSNGCGIIPMYDLTNDAAMVRAENKATLANRVTACGLIDLNATDNSTDIENLFARGIAEYKLGNGFDIAATYMAKEGDDIARLGIAYGRKIGANCFAKLRLLAPVTDSTYLADGLFVYNSSKRGASILILYDLENNSVHSELTGLIGSSNIKGFIQLVEDGPLDDLESKLRIGLHFSEKK